MQRGAILIALLFIAAACTPGPQSASSPTPTVPSTVPPSPSSLATASPTPSATPFSLPSPVARTVSGTARLTATAAGIAGVRVRVSPLPLGDGRAPGPDVNAVTDDRGAYTLNVMTWPMESLAGSSSFQLMIQVTPPPGLLVLNVNRALGGPPGGAAGNFSRPLILNDLSEPIDITLGPGHIIEGRISSGATGAPLADIGVLALGPGSMLIYGGQGDAFDIAASATSDATGTYRLTVPAGTYVIYTSGQQGGQSRFWSDDPAVFQPTRLTVERNITGIDLVLVRTTQLAGYVRSGPAFSDGVQDARVAVYAAGAPCCRLVGVATSGNAGTFVMYVPPGTYRIVFDPPSGSPYAAQWWRGATGFATATDVIVASDRVELEVELARRP